MKKIAIIGAGISGLFIANLFKQNPNYKVTIYEKNKSIELDEGYGIQLSTNSIKLLNEIGFNNIDKNEKFNPKKIDFYEINNRKKICDLNISEFNEENCKYTTLRRSKLIEFLKSRLNGSSIKYNHSIKKIESNKNKINLIFNKNDRVNCDILIISDGVFSKGKSIITNDKEKPRFNNCIAIRGNISKKFLNNLNKENISLFIGPKFHYVVYPLSHISSDFNFIGILNYKLGTHKPIDYDFFNNQNFVENIKNKLQNKISRNILENIEYFKCFPVYVSKNFYKPDNNVFLVGDALFAFPPSFAQGASQSIESASELYDSIVKNNGTFFSNRLKRIKMINTRSKLNHFTFHLSNPLIVFFRNLSLKILTKNKIFLKNYLGKIYKN
jgi:salicylate hydroxylase